MSKFLNSVFLLLVLTTTGERVSAQIFSKESFVRIGANDSPRQVLSKAARVRPSERQLRWQELELTGFLHFGINTFTDREWGDGTEDPGLFNPSNLDARQWVRTCRDAGIRQVILTAKHHDGFCLWPSRYTRHSVAASPWKEGRGDLVREVSEACREYGLGFGVYLSPWDRNSPYFGDSARYNDYFVHQLTELLTAYGRIDEVWFDGANGEGPNGKKQVYDFNRWYTLIRRLQPGAVIAVMGPDVRWVGTESGYGRETEWSVLPADELVPDLVAARSQQEVGFAPMNLMSDDLGSRQRIATARSLAWYPAEIDVSIRPGWFYHSSEDNQVKTPQELRDIYFSSVGRNGVLLLNIPPDRRGQIHQADINSLQAWKAGLDSIFARNLVAGARLSGRGKGGRGIYDGKPATFWTARRGDTTATLELELTQPAIADVLMLCEPIRQGQRIERFQVEYRSGGSWKPMTEGTTIGYKRLLRFAPVRIEALRLRILSSREAPSLSELGLYRQP